MRSARRRKTQPSTRTAFESLEPRAMLAGLGPDSFSGLGSNTAVLLPGGSGTNLCSDSPTSGSIGSSASPSGSGGTQSAYLTLSSSSVSAARSTSAGSSGSSTLGGLALQSSYGPGTGSSSAGTGSDSNPNGPVLSSQSSVASNADGQSSVVSAPGTTGAAASNYADGTASSAQAAAPSALSSLSGSSAGGWLDRIRGWERDHSNDDYYHSNANSCVRTRRPASCWDISSESRRRDGDRLGGVTSCGLWGNKWKRILCFRGGGPCRVSAIRCRWHH